MVTFSPDPSVVLAPDHPQRLLLSDGDRIGALGSIEGVDRVVVLDFTAELAALPYERFVRETLGGIMDLGVIVVGADFCLGAGGAGTVGALAELGRTDGFEVIGVPLLNEGGAPVTASRIRGLLGEGRVEAAAGLLGRCHVVSGEVEHGRGEGDRLWVPDGQRARARRPLPARRGRLRRLRRPRRHGLAGGDQRGQAPVLLARGGGGALPGGDAPGLFRTTSTAPRSAWPFGAMAARAARSFSSVGELERVVLSNVSWVRVTLGERGIDLSRGGGA